MDNGNGTTVRILDVAERLLQVRGYNGFSYGDVATELGITGAALHYHFAGKAELGLALVARDARRRAPHPPRPTAAGGLRLLHGEHRVAAGGPGGGVRRRQPALPGDGG